MTRNQEELTKAIVVSVGPIVALTLIGYIRDRRNLKRSMQKSKELRALWLEYLTWINSTEAKKMSARDRLMVIKQKYDYFDFVANH